MADDLHRVGIVGYADRLSVAPGESVGFCVSCEEEAAPTFRAEIVRLFNGDPNPRGPGYREKPVETVATSEYPVRRQTTRPGSCAIVPHDQALEMSASLSIVAMVWPTTPAKGRQGILTKWSQQAQAGYGLIVDDDGCLALLLGDGRGNIAVVSSGNPLLARCWYFAAASLDADTRSVSLYQEPVISSTNAPLSPLIPTSQLASSIVREVYLRPGWSGAPVVIAGWLERRVSEEEVIGGHYNGKIERPRLAARALSYPEMRSLIDDPTAEGVVAAWDFAREITPAGVRPFDRISDVSPNGLHGRTINGPARAMTGHNWSGREHRFSAAPAEYGAIHFHDDDLDDAGWTPDFEVEVPTDLSSGVYAAKLTCGPDEEYIPFFVRPPRGRATAAVGVLLPTNSYLAYANDNVAIDDPLQELATGRTPILSRRALHLSVHREYGGSLYDFHSDGSGTCYSSWRRPILTMRPKDRHTFARVWQFNADLHLLDWLDRRGIDVDILTDEDLHLEGAALLARYRVVVTGSHPEYCSGAMLDAIERYLQGGGRLMYLGGNGFYWVVGFHPERPDLIEVRRWGGTGNWSADPGECYLSFTGELGGIWRDRGRPPQKLVGIGFVAQGLDVSTHYRRTADGYDPRVAWIFEGIEEDEPIGGFGLMGEGASGLEIDSYDPALGSPPHAFLLASSEGHTSVMTEVRENFGGTVAGLGGDENPRVRSDLVYFTTPNGGAVFSTGSIAWCASLSYNNFDNNVARVTENVLRRFAADEPLPAH